MMQKEIDCNIKIHFFKFTFRDRSILICRKLDFVIS